jgi:hypothetical protein
MCRGTFQGKSMQLDAIGFEVFLYREVSDTDGRRHSFYIIVSVRLKLCLIISLVTDVDQPGTYILWRSYISCNRRRRLRHVGSSRSTAIPSMTSYTVNGRDEKHNKIRIRRASSIEPSSILCSIRSYVSSKLRGNDYRQWLRRLLLRGHRLRSTN